MQSKQKMRGKAQKQVSRRAGSVARVTRPRSKAKGQFQSRQQVSAPAVGGVIKYRNMLTLGFDRAPAHDEFPEGGLRIVGALPGSSSTSTLNGDYSGSGFGLWGTAGQCVAAVSPTGASGVGTVVEAPLFASTSPLAVISQYFRRYRFRKLQMEFTTAISTSNVNTTTLQISYERDAFTADSMVSTTTMNAGVNSSSVRFPAWQPRIMVPLIEQARHDRADELWYTTPAADSITTTDPSNTRMAFQGAVTAIAASLPTTAETIYGDVLWHFVVDLYGFTNKVAGVVPARLVRTSKPRCDPGDEKSRPEEPDYVSLTPRKSVAPLKVEVPDDKRQPPASTRQSSKK